MNGLSRFLFVFILICLALAPAGQIAHAQDGVSYQYFHQTGHNLTGEFWAFYKSKPNAQQLFGYPITEAFNEKSTGRLVQYFTRARFELYPDKPAGQRVELTMLGKDLYSAGSAINLFTPMGCRTFPNGLAVCYAFLEFFDKNGGELIFGAPVSAFEIYNNRIVQHFERARFEWYPELPEGQKVGLADLGRVYFDKLKEDTSLLSPVKPAGNDLTAAVISLQARAFAWKTVVLPGEQQSVYIVVQDQTLRPVANAQVSVLVAWADGTKESLLMPTDNNGVLIIPFLVKDQPYGSLVTVTVNVSYGTLTASAVTSFRVWR